MARIASVLVVALVALTACSQNPPVASSSGSRAVLEAYVQAWNRHDSLALDTLLALGAVHEDIAQGFRGEGADQVKAFMRELIKLEPDFNWHLTTTIADGPHIAAEWTWTATYTGPSPVGPVTTRRISGRGVAIAEVENGRIRRLTDYYDVASYFPPSATDSVGK